MAAQATSLQQRIEQVCQKTGRTAIQAVNAAQLVLVKKIGRGAFADVWRVEFQGSIVAAKLYETLQPPGSEEEEKQLEEIANTRFLGTHVNIIAVLAVCYQVASDGSQRLAGFLMPLAECSLEEYTKKRDPRLTDEENNKRRRDNMSDEEIARETLCVCEGVLQGVHHCHLQGLLHRDIKPGNILCKVVPPKHPEDVCLGDLGMARNEASTMTVGAGTLLYMPYEVLKSPHYSQSADVYAVGGIIMELLSGKRVFEGMGIVEVTKHLENKGDWLVGKTMKEVVPAVARSRAIKATAVLSLNLSAHEPSDRWMTSRALEEVRRIREMVAVEAVEKKLAAAEAKAKAAALAAEEAEKKAEEAEKKQRKTEKEKNEAEAKAAVAERERDAAVGAKEVADKACAGLKAEVAEWKGKATGGAGAGGGGAAASSSPPTPATIASASAASAAAAVTPVPFATLDAVAKNAMAACEGNDGEAALAELRRALAKAKAAKGAGGVAALLAWNGGEYGRALLHQAAAKGHEAAVKLLLDSGANKEATDNSGWTPLHLAAGDGHEATVKLLLDSGANKEAKTNQYGRTPLHLAARWGHEATVKLLLDSGANNEATDKYGDTPLHNAAYNGHEATVKLLLDSGANKEAKNEDGETPLHRAARWGHDATVKLLLDSGANKEAKNSDGRTPLDLALCNNNKAVAALLRL